MFGMRFTQDGYADGDPALNRQDKQDEKAAAQPGVEPTAPTAPSPTENPGPGPVQNPAPQGGNPAAPRSVPPAIVSSVPGIAGSEATGGVQGSFAQAGNAGFSKRFGMPAAWFQGGPSAGLAREAGNRGRSVLGADRAGATGGGFVAPSGGGSTVANVADPSGGEISGDKNDEQFQRILRQALANKFGRG